MQKPSNCHLHCFKPAWDTNVHSYMNFEMGGGGGFCATLDCICKCSTDVSCFTLFNINHYLISFKRTQNPHRSFAPGNAYRCNG